MEAVADLTLAALAEGRLAPLATYGRALKEAVEAVRPIFGRYEYGELYREAAVHPEWMATSLIANSEREGDGAGRLWSLSACTSCPQLAREVKRHALDESMHSRAYLEILDIVFPGCVDEGLRRDLDRLSPDYRAGDSPSPIEGSPYAHEVTLDDLVQMNIAEIRTRIHHLLQRPLLLLMCGDERRPRLQMILDRLLRDETAHVAYTARLIEAHPIDQVRSLMLRRMRDFSEITYDELDHRIFD